MRQQVTRILLSTFLLVGALYAQGSKATVEGVVTDPSGAVVPGVQIIIRNTATGTIARSETSSVGLYIIPNLEPGSYVLTAEVKGFKKYERKDIVLQVADRISLPIGMEVGASDQKITVVGEVQMMRFEDAQTGLVIDNKHIEELPQYDRNVLSLSLLSPNVNGSDYTPGNGHDFRINGGRVAATEIMVDGIPMTSGVDHTVAGNIPSPEAIGEFKVVTNGLSAEYGRLSGGVVMVATKSGTNDLHGSLYEYFRNNKMNANTWDANRHGVATAGFHDNIFGFTAGGPVWIPKIYNGRNKSFWFLNYEGLRHSEAGNLATGAFATPSDLAGDFSHTIDPTSGTLVKIWDPNTGRIVNGQLVRDLFPNATIPSNRIDPIVQHLFSLQPKGNMTPQIEGSNWVNWVGSTTYQNTFDKWTGRFDENWTSKQVTHVSVTNYDNASLQTRKWALDSDQTNNAPALAATIDHMWMVSPTTIVTGRLGVSRPIPFSGANAQSPLIDNSTWGVSSTFQKFIVSKQYMPTIWMTDGIEGMGNTSFTQAEETNYNASADIVKIVGKHTLKAGVDQRRYYQNYTQLASNGEYFLQFNTGPYGAKNWVEPGNGYSPATMLLGHLSAVSYAEPNRPNSLQNYWGSYIQDDYKVTPKLTVNVGLRWDYEPGRTEARKRQVFWDSSYKETIAPAAGWSWSQVQKESGIANLPQPGWVTQGIYGRPVMIGKDPFTDMSSSLPLQWGVGPRAGVAYQVTPNTVIRTSYGLIRLTSTGNNSLGNAPWNLTFGGQAVGGWPDSYDGELTYPATFIDPFPGGKGYTPNFTALSQDQLKTQMLQTAWWASNSQKFSIGHEHVVSMNIQHQFGQGSNSWVVELGYSGNFGRDLPARTLYQGTPGIQGIIGQYGSAMLNTYVTNPFATTLPAGAVQGGATIQLGQLYMANPLYQQLSILGDPAGTVNYNAGYAQVQHRYGHGFSLLASYTWSKLLQDCGSILGTDFGSAGGSGYPQAGKGQGDIYGLATNDYKHKLLFNYSVDIPIGHGRALLGSPQSVGAKILDKIVGGWTMAGTTTFRSGGPLPGPDSIGTNAWWTLHQLDDNGASRAVFVNHNYDPGVAGHQALIGSAGYTPYINASSFRGIQVTANSIEIGDVPITLRERGPAFSQWDFAILKKIPIQGEHRDLQLRLEAENVLNHMNCGMPDMNLGDQTFGMITSQAGNPRRIMISAKFHF